MTDMMGMFQESITFNQDIGDWDVAAVTDMSYMYVLLLLLQRGQLRPGFK